MLLPALLCVQFAVIPLTFSFWGKALAAETRIPLFMPGKKALYQCVVSHPDARLFAGPGQNAVLAQDKVNTFTPLYVYARQDKRLEVGVTAIKPDGWIDTDKTTDWPNALTMVFTDRMGRMPVLFFRDHDSLLKLLHDDNLLATIKKYAEMVSKDQALPSDFPVIAAEPAEAAVSRKNLYLMPILRRDELIRDKTLLLEVAYIDSETGNALGAGRATGWIADMDLEALVNSPEASPLRTVIPAVLLTKNQMHQLRERLSAIVADGDESIYAQDSYQKVFQKVISATAGILNDPRQFSRQPALNLVEIGTLEEYLDNLPYKSPVMTMTSQDWNAMDLGSRTIFLDRLKSLMALYDKYDKDTNLWIDNGSHTPGEAVCRLPLTELP